MKHLHASDLRGLARLATEAVTGVTRIAEGVHQSVWSTLGFDGGRAPATTGGLTGFVYRSIGGAVRLAGEVADAALVAFEGESTARDSPSASSQRIAWLGALNGVLGDHLVASRNPLALPMTLLARGVPLAAVAPTRSRRLLLRIHGLCLTELDWLPRAPDDSDHARALELAHGYITLDLRYNTGLPIAANGRALAALLDGLVAEWPEPVESLAIVAHSMGGLVARSAIHRALGERRDWPRVLRHVAFLGTPHHGAPLERAGHAVDELLASTRYSAPFAAFGRMRSAGITDLRHGRVLDDPAATYAGEAGIAHVPLPRGVACHAIAAATSARRTVLADTLIGDGLVPLRSALGQHDDTRRTLRFAARSKFIAWRTGHLALLRDAAVTHRLVRWLAP